MKRGGARAGARWHGALERWLRALARAGRCVNRAQARRGVERAC
ncbi:hypothetical protein [Alicyclobacillus macrosporangiidus]|nr:hypothetical protein [Alicyclobacillus macrosporangiidus]